MALSGYILLLIATHINGQTWHNSTNSCHCPAVEPENTRCTPTVPYTVLDPTRYGKRNDATVFNIGVILISESGAPYDLERAGVAIDMAVEEVNKNTLNASYMIQPIERKYGPVCDAAKAPG